VKYPDETEKILDHIIKVHGKISVKKTANLGDGIPTLKKLKAKSLGTILTQLAE